MSWPDALRITTSETILTEIIFSVSNEMSPTLATHFLGNKLWNIRIKSFLCPFLKHWQEMKGENKILKKGYWKSSYIKRKRKKGNAKKFIKAYAPLLLSNFFFNNKESLKYYFSNKEIWVGFLGVRFEVGGETTPCLKLVRYMLETSNLARQYTHIYSLTKYTF